MIPMDGLIKLGLNQSNSLAEALDARVLYRREFVIRRDHATCRTEGTPGKRRQRAKTAANTPDRESKARPRPIVPKATTRSTPVLFRSNLAFDHQLLDFRNGQGGIESLGAGLRAIHDGMAAIEAERVFEIVEPVTGRLVAAVDDPGIGLTHHGGAGQPGGCR